MLGNSGVIMAQCTASYYGFKAMILGAQLTIPAAHTFLERCEAKRGSVEQGDGDAKPIMAPMGAVLSG